MWLEWWCGWNGGMIEVAGGWSGGVVGVAGVVGMVVWLEWWND